MIMNHTTTDYHCLDLNSDKYALAMGYVPWQEFTKTYDNLEEAYKVGSIFPELTKPFSGRRCS